MIENFSLISIPRPHGLDRRLVSRRLLFVGPGIDILLKSGELGQVHGDFQSATDGVTDMHDIQEVNEALLDFLSGLAAPLIVFLARLKVAVTSTPSFLVTGTTSIKTLPARRNFTDLSETAFFSKQIDSSSNGPMTAGSSFSVARPSVRIGSDFGLSASLSFSTIDFRTASQVLRFPRPFLAAWISSSASVANHPVVVREVVGSGGGQKAWELAGKACQVTDYQQPVHLAALAAAYAELGDFNHALEYAKKAVQLTEGDKDDILAQIKSYENKQPYRQQDALLRRTPDAMRVQASNELSDRKLRQNHAARSCIASTSTGRD